MRCSLVASSARFLLVCLVALAPLLAPTPATAAEGENVLSLHGGWAKGDASGGGAGIAWWYGFDDFWNLRVDGGWAYLPNELAGEIQVFDVGVSALYHVDAFQWVPSFHIGLAGLVALETGVDDPLYGFGLGVGGGIDYRPVRRWGVGLYLDWKGPLVGDAPGRMAAGVRLNVYL